MHLTDSRFIEELIFCIKSDEAVALSFKEHPEAWSGKNYAGQQNMRRAISRRVRAGLKYPPEKKADMIRSKMIE